MKTASAISTLGHAAVLLWAVLSFTGKTFEVTPAESLPVDLVSESELSQMTKGVKTAPKAEIPKPLVEKLDEVAPTDDPKPKVEEKKKEVAKAAEPPPAETKPDPIAEKIQKQDEKKPDVKADNKPLPPKKPEQKPERTQPKFDADKIAALLDKRDPQRNAATGAQLNDAPTLGTAMGNASKLSQSEIDALRARLMALWNPPVGIQNPEELIIRIRIRLGRDGRLSSPPMVLTSGTGQVFTSARDSAVRAVFQGQPFDMLKPDHYDTWKDIEVTFDPKDMFGG
jgi:outer membrane biosynthesis protein TonB